MFLYLTFSLFIVAISTTLTYLVHRKHLSILPEAAALFLILGVTSVLLRDVTIATQNPIPIDSMFYPNLIAMTVTVTIYIATRYLYVRRVKQRFRRMSRRDFIESIESTHTMREIAWKIHIYRSVTPATSHDTLPVTSGDESLSTTEPESKSPSPISHPQPPSGENNTDSASSE